jgi:hypothetical protein
MTPEETYLDIATKRFAATIRKKAQALRDAADDIDRRADRTFLVGTDQFRGAEFADNFAWVAHEVQHDVMTALFNLHLDSLTTDAYDLDSMRQAKS